MKWYFDDASDFVKQEGLRIWKGAYSRHILTRSIWIPLWCGIAFIGAGGVIYLSEITQQYDQLGAFVLAVILGSLYFLFQTKFGTFYTFSSSSEEDAKKLADLAMDYGLRLDMDSSKKYYVIWTLLPNRSNWNEFWVTAKLQFDVFDEGQLP